MGEDEGGRVKNTWEVNICKKKKEKKRTKSWHAFGCTILLCLYCKEHFFPPLCNWGFGLSVHTILKRIIWCTSSFDFNLYRCEFILQCSTSHTNKPSIIQFHPRHPPKKVEIRISLCSLALRCLVPNSLSLTFTGSSSMDRNARKRWWHYSSILKKKKKKFISKG